MAGVSYSELVGAEVVQHYGDERAEYRAMRDTVGVIVRADIARFRMWGRDPVRMLNGLITNDLSRLDAENAIYALMLTPKGRTIADLRALSRATSEGDEILIDVPLAAANRVAEHLAKYIPPHFARWQRLEDDSGVIGVYGPGAVELVERALGVRPDPTEDRVTRVTLPEGRAAAVGTRFVGVHGIDLFVDAGQLATTRDLLLEHAREMEGRVVGFGALEMLRVEAGRPRAGLELTDETLPAEALATTHQMERAVSFTKGCYTGQEVVVRIAHRGHVNRRLLGLLLGDVTTPAPGTALYAGEPRKEVGRITSATFSPLLEQTIALAYVRREVEVDATVQVGESESVTATVVELPFAR